MLYIKYLYTMLSKKYIKYYIKMYLFVENKKKIKK